MYWTEAIIGIGVTCELGICQGISMISSPRPLPENSGHVMESHPCHLKHIVCQGSKALPYEWLVME